MRRFTTTLTTDAKRRAVLELPFDPDEVWGDKPRHPVGGTLDGRKVRGVAERTTDGSWIVPIAKTWLRDCSVAVGGRVEVELIPEGPQRGDLAPDVAAALEADPGAAAFFDGLAQFYRKAYLRWIDATTKRPDVRAERIAEVVGLLAEGKKERTR